jgi:toxin-antitoxin system PIN domain toxin
VIAFDTNILFPLVVSDHPDHDAVSEFIRSLDGRDDVALSEFALVELYGLLRQPAVMRKPLGPAPAAGVCTALRKHPRWRLLGFPGDSAALHRALWEQAARPGFAKRRIYDARLALCLLAQGVREFATANVKDFAGLGFRRVFNPLA